MNCKTTRSQLNALLDRALTPASEAEVLHHVSACSACWRAWVREQNLRRLLREQPVPASSPDFAARVLHAAMGRAGGRYRRGFAAGFGVAAAAALAIWIGSVTIPFGGKTPVPAVTLTAHEIQTVRLVFDSPRDLQDATIVLRLPASTELAGYPGRRELAWQASLRAGANALALPIVVNGAQGGELTARIAYGDDEKTFRLRLDVRPAPKALRPGRAVWA